MVSWKALLVVVVSGLGLFSEGCTDNKAANEPHLLTHTAARRRVTGSNIPQAPAYGDGVDEYNATAMQNKLDQRSSVGGGAFGGGGGGGR